jgi:hypothetical protein
MINEYGAAGGIRTGTGNFSIRRDTASACFSAINPTLPQLGFNRGSNGAEYKEEGCPRRIIKTRQSICRHIIDNLYFLVRYEVHSFSNEH